MLRWSGNGSKESITGKREGIGYFSSEIGPSALFAAYKTTKKMEKQGKNRAEIAELLKEKFGEKNPDVKV